jgi:ferredoxin-NADP reductase
LPTGATGVRCEPSELMFRAELAHLATRLDLTVLEVVRRPPPGWTGATGEVGLPLLRSVLPHPVHRAGIDYFVCGPPAFVEQVADGLGALGIPDHRLHTEQF